MIPRIIALLAPLAFLPLHGVAAQAASGPTLMDPPLDTLHPPSQVELTIPSHGVPLNGFLYLPQGAGRHRVVVMLHGYPGVEKNLDLAQALRRAGFAVLYFDYRGSWGTGGTFSYANALADAAAALAWVRSPAIAARFRLDDGRVALVGHSFGGWLAIMTLAADPRPLCVAVFAPFNRPAEARLWASQPRQRAAMIANLQATTDPQSGPIRARAEDLVRELEAHARTWDLVGQAALVRDRPLLLVTGKRDTPHMAIRGALLPVLRQAGASHVRDVVFDDDHAFSAHRIASAELVVDWLARDCGP